jgi:hypothetical protein
MFLAVPCRDRHQLVVGEEDDSAEAATFSAASSLWGFSGNRVRRTNIGPPPLGNDRF